MYTIMSSGRVVCTRPVSIILCCRNSDLFHTGCGVLRPCTASWALRVRSRFGELCACAGSLRILSVTIRTVFAWKRVSTVIVSEKSETDFCSVLCKFVAQSALSRRVWSDVSCKLVTGRGILEQSGGCLCQEHNVPQ